MSEDFCNAAHRHFIDAQVLHTQSRLANADHLYGFAAECALKAVALGLGMPITEKAERTAFRKHIDKFWEHFVIFANNNQHVHYASQLAATPFDNWKADQRYLHESHISDPALETHKQAAERTMQILEKAMLDGILP